MGGVRKPLIEIGGRSVLQWALAPFLARDDVVEVVVALAGGRDPETVAGGDARVRVVGGGDSRFGSVAGALDRVTSRANLIAVHDGARPFPPPGAIDACIRLAAAGYGAVAGIPAVDTVKRADEAGRIVETPPREALWYAQTPQVFPRELFTRAVAHCRGTGISLTDDASMVEALGAEVRMVPASGRNLKITRPPDVVTAEAYLVQGLV